MRIGPGKSHLLIACLVLLAVGAAVSCVSDSEMNSPEATPTSGAGIDFPETLRWEVSSLAEAESTAGYSLAYPGFVPAGFVQDETIAVTQPGFKNAERYVTRSWIDPNNPSIGFILEQNPNETSLGGAEPAVINGVEGQRQVLEPIPPGRQRQWLVLSWAQNGFSYTLLGPLTGPLTEEVYRKIAASVGRDPRSLGSTGSP